MANSEIDEPPALVFDAEVRSLLGANDPFSRYRELYHRLEHLDVVQRALYTDCGIILPDLFFEKVDKATMAHGIEVRVPLVDTRLASYVMGLPAKYKVRGLARSGSCAKLSGVLFRTASWTIPRWDLACLSLTGSGLL